MITYEETGTPRFAVAEPGTSIEDAMQWVQANPDPLMVRDLNGCYMLVHIDASGRPVIEPPGIILNTTDTRLAASRFRGFLGSA